MVQRMAETVKRSYESPLRAQAAGQTRRLIRSAAAQLFITRGVVASTVRQVAEQAGVSPRTVHVAFPGGKTQLFHEALNVAIGGDDADIPVADRPQWQGILDEPDGRRAIALSVDFGAELLERAGPLVMAGIESSGADADMRRLADEGSDATMANMRAFARSLKRHGGLRDGLGVNEAAEILYAMGSPHMHELLRRRSGWSAQHYRRWLTETLIAALH